MAIKEQQTSYREYYKLYKEAMEEEYRKQVALYEKLEEENKTLYEEVTNNKDLYKRKCNFDITSYNDYNENRFISKQFEYDVKRLFIKYTVDDNLRYALITLCKYANNIKKLYDAEITRKKYRVFANVSMSQYKDYLFQYFTEVHKQMILDGAAYDLGGRLGKVCINRCKLRNARPKINYAATKKKKQELINQGVKLYDKDEAEFCKQNGIDYDGVDYRVFLDKDYVYEIPLIYATFNNYQSAKFIVADYRSRLVRGKTNEELIEECKFDTKEIVKLPLDIRTKLHMCLSVDKILHSKFIRNENQKPVATSKAYR